MAKLTKRKVAAALMEAHGVVAHAARLLGVTREHLSTYIARYPELQQVRDEARERLLDVAEEGLFDAVKKRRPWALQYVLSRLGKHRGYTERTEQEQVGEIRVKVIREDA